MKEKITDERLVAFLEGENDAEIKKQLAADPSLQKRLEDLQEILNAITSTPEAEVPPHVKAGFQAALIQEQIKPAKAEKGWMQLAAAVAILIVGFAAGRYADQGSSQELLALREEIQSLREVTLTNTLQKHSASERIMAVNQIEQNTKVNRKLISTLISTLNTDESPNVRYAALQALEKYTSDAEVRAELVKSLERQNDPLIQISLITLLVEAEERSAIAPLRKILEKEHITPEVKQQAEIAIQVLT